MNKDKLFVINGHELLMERVLIEMDEVPVLFVCRDGEERYMCLCTDISPMEYYISKVNWLHILALLEGDRPMRDIFLQGSSFWSVRTGNDIADDHVEEVRKEDIRIEDLPKEGAFYQICSEDVEDYRKELSDKIYNSKAWISFISRLSQVISGINKEQLKVQKYLLIFEADQINLGMQLENEREGQKSVSVQMMTREEMSVLAA